MSEGWRFGLLGPLTVFHNGSPVEVRAAKHRVLLAALLVNANRVVPVEELIDGLWEDDPPAGASTTLRSYVMRLRRTLGADAPIVTRPEGYLIEVDDDALDIQRFDTLVRQADPNDPVLLREALALWRGDALSDVPSEFLRQKLVPAWEERRLLAVESKVDADLRLGRHRELIPALAELTAAHPFREKFWQQRMLALYRSDRQADALDCYRSIAELLAGELGVDPGPELRELHRAVLANEVPPAEPPEPERPVQTHRNDLPGDITDFSGRDEDLRSLIAALDTARTQGSAIVITAIDGMAGIGKTALAVHAAHQLRDQYPDAQLFIDLRAHTADTQPTEPAAALDTLLRAVGVPGERIPADLDDRAALWRSEMADRNALVVLDNAASAAQVRPLLPGAAGCLVLITSRRRLTDLDADSFSLDVLDPEAALTLFTKIVGIDRVAAEQDAARDVIRLCGLLPLAIRVAAARLRARQGWTINRLVGRLSDERRRLSELEVGDRSIAATFALSYRDLSTGERRLFRLLGLVPVASFGVQFAAALAAVSNDDVERMLELFVDVHLLQEPGSGRYCFHDLLRDHSHALVQQIESIEDRDATIDRLLDFYLTAANRAARVVEPTARHIRFEINSCSPWSIVFDCRDDADFWFEDERLNLISIIGYSVTCGRFRQAWQLACLIWHFLISRGYTHDCIVVHETARIAAEQDGDDQGQALTLEHLGVAYGQAARYEQAMRCFQDARELYRATGDLRGKQMP